MKFAADTIKVYNAGMSYGLISTMEPVSNGFLGRTTVIFSIISLNFLLSSCVNTPKTVAPPKIDRTNIQSSKCEQLENERLQLAQSYSQAASRQKKSHKTTTRANSVDRNISSIQFDTQVVKTSHSVPVLVNFGAPWCGPCRQMTPVLKKLAKRNTGQITVVTMNIDDNKDLATLMELQAIPAVVAYANGKQVDKIVGMKSESDIREFVNNHAKPPKIKTNEKMIDTAEMTHLKEKQEKNRIAMKSNTCTSGQN